MVPLEWKTDCIRNSSYRTEGAIFAEKSRSRIVDRCHNLALSGIADSRESESGHRSRGPSGIQLGSRKVLRRNPGATLGRTIMRNVYTHGTDRDSAALGGYSGFRN